MTTRPAGDDDRLAAVFRAAAAPAHAAELAGEDAAVAAFRAAAVTEQAAAPERTSTLRNVLAKVLTVKAVVVLAVAGSAGIVVAATGGVLPTPWSAPPSGQQATTPAPAPTATTRTTAPTPPSAEGTAAPEIVELCRKYLHRGREDKVLGNPAFDPLIDAAGGVEKVAAYCVAHAEDKPGNKPEDKPGDKKTDKKTPPATPKSNENGNGPGEHGRPDNPGNSANPEVPGNNGNQGNPPNSPAREPRATEPHKPENARTGTEPAGRGR